MFGKNKSKGSKHSKGSRDSHRSDKNDKGKKSDGTKTKTKAKIHLHVAIYQPEYGNLHHWALYLDTHNYVYQVVGEPMGFTADVSADILPSNSGRFVESVQVAQIQEADVAALDEIIRSTPVQNDVQGWCCQDYVMEALELLNEEQIVDDEDYDKVRPRLMRRFNR
jgi:hypothetical protein